MGARSESTTHKLFAITNSLKLESASFSYTCGKVYSIMSDMGVESGLWVAPDFSKPNDLSFQFPRALPVADGDHSLHHVTKFA
jgi:uncharacterized protein (DUF1015 family)